MNPKEEFRVFCSQYIPYIQNIELPIIQEKTMYEAVFIEFRILPHLEFLIRNTILKLGNEWCHTIVCGNLNYAHMKNLCNSISPNINVIRLNYNNLNQSTYSILLATTKFWNMFHGTKILIYQEDSILFKTNIRDFIEWDYIGAPWQNHQNDTTKLVGNGGLSLRTKQIMLDVIAKQDIKTIKLNSGTINYMNHAKLTICPEDVFFCKTMEDFNIGRISDWNTASNFSTEGVLNLNSLGGHNFWIPDLNWKERMNIEEDGKPLNIIYLKINYIIQQIIYFMTC